MAALRRHWAVVALVAWTFFVWTTRIGNIWNDDGLDTADRLGRTALALSFTLLALGVVAALRNRPGRLRRAVDALAVWTVAVWLVRGLSITVGDHDTAFKVVHAVLAVVSIALAVLAGRSVRAAAAAPAPGAPDEGERIPA
jgi:peptidoglycan/LPS O-acetylase OafA/YrhL